ncbi:MAG TPA: GntR family transcriptional regulator [Pyrinomonadaceae bacterium]|nr:GntR family transcriptional regulator [Pyrinomonadaceae bacterium]
MMFFRPNPASGVPVYIQLMEQVRHFVETGALRPGDQLPAIRKVAEELVVNPNTVAKVYRELEHEGVIELRHGAGAFVAERGRVASGTDERLRKAQTVVRGAVQRLDALGLAEDEMRRLFEAEARRLREGDEASSRGVARAQTKKR